MPPSLSTACIVCAKWMTTVSCPYALLPELRSFENKEHFKRYFALSWPKNLCLLWRYVSPCAPVEYHRALLPRALYSRSMSTLIVPLILTFAMGFAAYLAHRTMNQVHRKLLEVELGGRNYDELSDHDRYFLNETVNIKFQHSMGGRLATFVVLYAYPTLYIGEKMLGRTHWSAVEVFGGSSIIYFLALALVGQLAQVVALG